MYDHADLWLQKVRNMLDPNAWRLVGLHTAGVQASERRVRCC